MLKLKKFLSVLLSLTFVFNFGTSLKSEAFIPKEFESDCAQKNSKGGYIEDGCAYWEAENALLNEKKDYVVIENLGPLADRTFYYFSFNALDKILDVVNQPTDEMQKEIDKLEQKKNSLKRSMLPKISLSSALGAVGGHLSARLFDWCRAILYNNRKRGYSKKDIKLTPVKIMLYAGTGIFELVGAVAAGLLSAVCLSTKQDNLKDEILKINKEMNKINQYRHYALEGILDDIKEASYKDKDYFCIKTNPSNCWMSYLSSIGLNYTEAQREAFEPKFQKLAKDIEDAIKDMR